LCRDKLPVAASQAVVRSRSFVLHFTKHINNFVLGGHIMSLRYSPEGNIDRKVLLAIAAAIRSIEAISGCIEEYEIGRDDSESLSCAISDLWSILESNGYTIDVDTN
jgi:hypothetical protein